MIALTIAGSDSGGGAGIQADIKTFAALGVHGLSVVTALTAQNTRGVEEVFEVPADFVRAQMKALEADFEIRAAKTGMLCSGDLVKVVAKEIGDYPLVVDPVMAAQAGGRLLEEDALDTLKERLFPRALLATPNIPEAEALPGIRIKGIRDMRRACQAIAECGCNVVVKGGHLNAVDVLYLDGTFHELKARRLPYSAHGSGCTFAAAIAAQLAMGRELLQAMKGAKAFVTGAIADAYSPGKGRRVVNPMAAAERVLVLEELRGVVAEMEQDKRLCELIPEVGSNIAYALPNARGPGDVAAVRGRIVRVGNEVRAVGGVAFGASKHVATITLTAMAFDPAIRSAMNIRYGKDVLRACKGLQVSSFSREEEPRSVSTMEWGTRKAIKALGRVPDVIYDLGAVGKEPMVRVFGRDPREVWGTVVGILERL
ncbi:MAG: bifunctional hydroxymethylpyrimidine kinase/phosphomethylpyrimidine kinase [Candidatus Hydrothermarchaeota archaeon]